MREKIKKMIIYYSILFVVLLFIFPTIHGDQIDKFYHGYYKHYCFLPLYEFSGKHLLAAYLWPSNIDAAYGA